jgi:hypothetical protein
LAAGVAAPKSTADAAQINHAERLLFVLVTSSTVEAISPGWMR